MTDNSSFEDALDETGTAKKPVDPDLRGRYVEGDYGSAGMQSGRHADDEEGQYIEGDYGAAGSEGGLPEPLGEKARESGRYVKADFGATGSTAGRTAESEIGRYPGRLRNRWHRGPAPQTRHRSRNTAQVSTIPDEPRLPFRADMEADMESARTMP